jgi:hypothetical protein
VSAEDAAGISAVSGLQDGVAVRTQHQGEQTAELGVILGQENRRGGVHRWHPSRKRTKLTTTDASSVPDAEAVIFEAECSKEPLRLPNYAHRTAVSAQRGMGSPQQERDRGQASATSAKG